MRLVALTLALLSIACARPIASSPTDITSDERRARAVDELHLLLSGSLPEPAARRATVGELASGKLTLEHLVDRLLLDPRFAKEIAPRLLLDHLAEPLEAMNPSLILKKQEVTGKPPVYYARGPCPRESAISVRPWWDASTSVLVCPDSYQPEHLKDPATGFYCGGYNLDLDRSEFCGCGPNLMNCTESEEQRKSFYESMRREVTDTVAWIVTNDLPAWRAYTQNETIRDARVEFMYQRWRVNSGEIREIPDLRSFSTNEAPLARFEASPGQHAGVLTTPQLVYESDAVRPRQRDITAHLWCIKPKSSRASTEVMLELGATDLRDGEGWKKLAAMPLCTDCHARLDYGMQFFAGYPNRYVTDSYLPPRPSTELGLLYVDGIHDLRGRAAATPKGFADLAVQQPEFSECAVERTVAHVFGESATSDDRRALLAQFRKRYSLRDLVRVALQRYVKRDRPTADAPEPAPATQAPLAGTDNVSLLPGLRDLLHARCVLCHAEGELDFARDALPRGVLSRMLEQVSFRGMPRTFAGLDRSDRRRFVQQIAAALFDDPDERKQAIEFHLGDWRSPEIRASPLVSASIRGRAGFSGELPNDNPYPEPGYVEGAPRLTADAAALTAFQALVACRARSNDPAGDAGDRCLHEALDPAIFLHGDSH